MHSIEKSDLLFHSLSLIPGAIVMLKKSMGVKKNTNATRMIIKALFTNTISAKIIIGEYVGTVYIFSKILFTVFKKLQFPGFNSCLQCQ